MALSSVSVKANEPFETSILVEPDDIKQQEILDIVEQYKGKLSTELVLSIIRVEGGEGAFHSDGWNYNDFYKQEDGPWAQPSNNDGIMQVTIASGWHERSGSYTNDLEGYTRAISDGCGYLNELYGVYGSEVQAALHYNTGPNTLYIYLGLDQGNRNYLGDVRYYLNGFVSALYNTCNSGLAGILLRGQEVLDDYLYDKGVETGHILSYYQSYQLQLDAELNAIEPYEPAIEWEKTFGGAEDDWGFSVQVAGDGGYIITGYTKSYGAGADDVYLVKTDSSGNLMWNKTFGGTQDDIGWSVQVTDDGGYIIAGWTNSSGVGRSDVYLVKTDSSGNLMWNKTFGGTDYDRGNSVQVVGNGDYIIAGWTTSSGVGRSDVYLVKTDSSGNLMWNKTFGGTQDDIGFSVQVTDDGGYIITGTTTSSGAGRSDVYLVKTDSSGNLMWNKTFGGTDWDIGYSVQVAGDGGYIITGHTNSSGAGADDVYLVKTINSFSEAIDPVQLSKDIQNKLEQTRPYPLYMIDINSFSGVIQTTWMDFTAWLINADTRERYSDFYFSGIELDSLSINSLIKAKQFLKKGDLENAKKYYELSIRYEYLSDICFQTAQNIFENNLEEAEEIAQRLYFWSKKSASLSAHFVNPQAATVINTLYLATDYAITSQLEGVNEANKNLIVDQIVSKFYTEIIFDPDTGGNLADIIKNSVGKKVFPILEKGISSERVQWAMSKVIKEVLSDISEATIKDQVQLFIENIQNVQNGEYLRIQSPCELSISNEKGLVTGLIDGSVKHELDRSYYFNDSIRVYYPNQTFSYQVTGFEDGYYGLLVSKYSDGTNRTYMASGIPTAREEVHEYTIDWVQFDDKTDVVVVTVDKDGDGSPERIFNSDVELDGDEFLLKCKTKTSLYCEVDREEVTVGELFVISGSVNASISGVEIIITLVKNNDGVEDVSVFTESDGSYSYNVKADLSGIWEIYSSWEGDDGLHGANSDQIEINVLNQPTVIPFLSNWYLGIGIIFIISLLMLLKSRK